MKIRTSCVGLSNFHSFILQLKIHVNIGKVKNANYVKNSVKEKDFQIITLNKG